MDMEKNNISGIENEVKSITCTLDRFQEVMKLANPQITNELCEYDFNTQLMVSLFTRIYNLKVLLYILDNYIHKGMKMSVELEAVLEQLSEKYCRDYNGADIAQINVFDLMESEITYGMCDKDASLRYQIIQLGLLSFQMEKEFYERECLCWLEKQKNKAIFQKQREKAERIYKKQKEKWDVFEQKYKEYLNRTNKRGNTKKPYGMADIFQKKEITTVSVTKSVFKSTISFLKMMEANRDKVVARTFFSVFNNYKQGLNLDGANPSVMAGHIFYFRLMNIMKMDIMVQQYGIEAYYDGFQISEILTKSLEDSQIKTDDIICVDLEKIQQMLNKDLISLLGEESDLTSPEMIRFLYCSYLSIENAWLNFDYYNHRKNTKNAFDRFLLDKYMFNKKVINGFYRYLAKQSGYGQTINQINRKVINFPK